MKNPSISYQQDHQHIHAWPPHTWPPAVRIPLPQDAAKALNPSNCQRNDNGARCCSPNDFHASPNLPQPCPYSFQERCASEVCFLPSTSYENALHRSKSGRAKYVQESERRRSRHRSILGPMMIKFFVQGHLHLLILACPQPAGLGTSNWKDIWNLMQVIYPYLDVPQQVWYKEQPFYTFCAVGPSDLQ